MLARSPEKCAGPGGLLTLSLQIDNRIFDDDPPAANAEQRDEHGRWERVPYQAQRTFTEVGRSGAATLYPRSALARRFHWDPRYNEEHQSYFDELAAIGFRHWLLQDPSLATHLMVRESGHREAIRRARERYEAENHA
jgi:hypothetical protein